MPEPESTFGLQELVARGDVGASRTGIIVVAQPFSCGLSDEDIRYLNRLHGDGRISVTLTFVATAADSTAVAAVASDMGLEVPYRTIEIGEYGDLVTSAGLRAPAFVLARRGRPLLTVTGLEPSLGLGALEVVYGARR